MKIAIDLFSGCGGLTQGLIDAGFEVKLGCEIRPEARASYKLNHQHVILENDVRKLTGKAIFKKLGIKKGELDLLAACPPCQGFSSIRTRNGEIVDDERNELIFEVLRLIKELKPKTILIENVPRLLQDDRIHRFKEALSKDYQFSEGVLDAKNFSVPQRRKRMIVIGSRGKAIPIPTGSEKLVSVREAIGHLPNSNSDEAPRLHKIRQALQPKTLQRIRHIKRNRSELPESLMLNCHKRYQQGFRDVYGRIDMDDVAPTMTRSSHNPSKGRFVHPVENRGLTIYEILLLQGFPPDYKLASNIGIGKLGSLLGEAFPPPMALEQAKQIMQYLQQRDSAKLAKK